MTSGSPEGTSVLGSAGRGKRVGAVGARTDGRRDRVHPPGVGRAGARRAAGNRKFTWLGASRAECPGRPGRGRADDPAMTQYRIAEAARLLGVSDDTVRRWVDTGRLTGHRTRAGAPVTVSGADLADLARQVAATSQVPCPPGGSARNRMAGLVTRVVRDGVMAQVEIQAGPYRIVSLMSREAADELELEPGAVAVAVVKATQVAVEPPSRP